MLQSDDDRWPMWEQELETDDQDVSQAKAEKSDKRGSPGKGGQKSPKYGAGSSISDSLRYASMGTELFAAVLIGTLIAWGISYLIGLVTGNQPTWIIALGVFFGAIAGFLNMYRTLQDIEKEEEQQKREKRGSSK